MSASAVMTIINSLFLILGGIVVFMLGMEMMGSNLERAAGKNIRKLMGKAAKNRFTGVGTGAAVTALVNSSAATTVMIVGFVNVGLMTLTQAASVIMGANIGTTISAFIMALSSAGGSYFSVTAIFALIAFAGFVITLVSKKDKVKRIGNILEGVGIIFIGLNVMSGAVSSMLDNAEINDAVRKVFQIFEPPLTWEIIVLFLLGALLTALMQSSAALTAIVISLASQNLITLQAAMCIILGANVGTCLTSLISSVGATVNAKRAAAVHLLFNVAGCVIFIFPVAFAGNYIAKFLNSFIANTEWQIAIFHMFFNLVTTLVMLPFLKLLVKLACLIIPDKKNGKELSSESGEILDERLLKTPAIAVGQARKEIVRMGNLAFTNYKRALDMLLAGNLDGKETFDETEKQINSLNKYITQFLIKLSSQEISEVDERKVSSFYHVTSDMERIGDYAENITEYAEKMSVLKVGFSEHALDEIRQMDMHLTELYRNVELAFANHDLSYMPKIEEEEDATDNMCKTMQQSHIRRTDAGRCTPEAGAVFLQLAVNMERIGDHMYNIANSQRIYVNGDRKGL
ncbi:MAG: Na/Pi cotransporter family protein [Clostridiales bacterium]|nr:Na/Pi cotransporter family protein [Clostridiales bacterium]